MRKFIQNKLKDQKGLTLIELLAVIVILAIIAAIAIPAIGNIIENSKVGAIKADAQNVLAAANIYYTDTPTATSPVSVTTLLNGYLQDAGSIDTAATVAKVTGGNELSGAGGETGSVTIQFTSASNSDISDVPNNSETGTAGVVAITRP